MPTGNTNVINGTSNNNTLTGTTGHDLYNYSGSQNVINEKGGSYILKFDNNIHADQLWFKKSGNHLKVSAIGTSNKVTINNWYTGNQYHVEEIQTSDGLLLLDSQVQNMVQAMAGMTPPPAGQTSLPPEYQTQLNAVITANWK